MKKKDNLGLTALIPGGIFRKPNFFVGMEPRDSGTLCDVRQRQTNSTTFSLSKLVYVVIALQPKKFFQGQNYYIMLT